MTALRGIARRNGERTLEVEPVIAAAFCGMLGLVCLSGGLEPAEVWRQLARRGRGRRSFAADRAWREASDARAIALYLTNTIGSVPGAMLARAIGVRGATVCRALRRVEDLREGVAFDRALDALAYMATGKQP